VTELRFYLDENLELEIANQLRRRNVDAVHVRELGLRGDSDEAQLQNATEQGPVLCTYDSDFVNFARQGTQHAGIVKGNRVSHNIGSWVKTLSQLHSRYGAEDMVNRVNFYHPEKRKTKKSRRTT